MNAPPTSHENMLGAYRLLRELGQGGMGTVYLAQDETLHRAVAVKVLRGEENERGAAARARRFLREAQAAAGLNHPNVVTIYTVGKQGPRPYIVMEYVEGGSLAEALRKNGPMGWREAARAVVDALRGLAAAHKAGIVHRDVKPANLMLGRAASGEAVIKLADFGLARAYELKGAEEDLTFPGAFVGSPSYAAPEQIAGVHHIDGRADIYSLAATGYALLTGQPPFVGDDPQEVMDRHLREAFPDARELAPGVPGEFWDVLLQASRKKAEERFAGAAEMLLAMERVRALPVELAHTRPAAKEAPASRGRGALESSGISRVSDTVIELESRLESARRQSDSTTQLATLRALVGLYSQLDRRADAEKRFREALVLHVKLAAPGRN